MTASHQQNQMSCSQPISTKTIYTLWSLPKQQLHFARFPQAGLLSLPPAKLKILVELQTLGLNGETLWVCETIVSYSCEMGEMNVFFARDVSDTTVTDMDAAWRGFKSFSLDNYVTTSRTMSMHRICYPRWNQSSHTINPPAAFLFRSLLHPPPCIFFLGHLVASEKSRRFERERRKKWSQPPPAWWQWHLPQSKKRYPKYKHQGHSHMQRPQSRKSKLPKRKTKRWSHHYFYLEPISEDRTTRLDMSSERPVANKGPKPLSEK